MNFPHDIIRDAWAVRHGGRTEVPVGQDRIDVVVDGAQYDTLVEVKPAHQVREAIGQGNSYQRRWARPSKKHLVLFHETGLPAKSTVERLRTHQDSGELSSFTWEIVPAVPRPSYCIAGVPISLERPIKDICDQVGRIKRDFQFNGGPIPANDKAFLHYLIVGGQRQAQGAQLAWGAKGIELQVVRFDNKTFALSSRAAAVDWLRQANYKAVYGTYGGS
jgi:hypothetical protein